MGPRESHRHVLTISRRARSPPQAAFRCGAAAEHFEEAATIVLNPKVAGAARSWAKFKARNEALGNLYLDASREDNTEQLGLLPRICTALLNAIWTHFWNLAPMVAESIAISLSRRCSGEEFDAAFSMLALPQPSTFPSPGSKRRFEDTEPAAARGEDDRSARIEAILGELASLLHRNGLTDAAGGAVGAGDPSTRGAAQRGKLLDNVTAELNERLRRRMDTRAASAQKPLTELERRQEELWAYTSGQLKEVIQSRGLTITQKGLRKPGLVNLILNAEFPDRVAKRRRGGAAM